MDSAPQRALRGRAPHTTTRRRPLWASHVAPSHAITQAAVNYILTEAQRLIGRRVVAHGAGLKWIRRRSEERAPPTTTRRRSLWASHDAPSRAIAQAAVDYTPTEAQRIIGRRVVAHGAGLMKIRRRRGRGRSPPPLVGGRCGPATTRQAAPFRRKQSIAPSRRRSVSLGAGDVHTGVGLKWIRRRRGGGRSPSQHIGDRCGPATTRQAAPLRRQQSITPLRR